MRAEQTSFLFGANAPFIEELYARYLGDPQCRRRELAAPSSPRWPSEGRRAGARRRGACWAPNGARVIGAGRRRRRRARRPTAT